MLMVHQAQPVPYWAPAGAAPLRLAAQIAVNTNDSDSLEVSSQDGESLSRCSSCYTRGVGTWAYASPECLRNEKYDEKVDIFSLGCVLFEMLTLRKTREIRVGESDDSATQAMITARAQDIFNETFGMCSCQEPFLPFDLTQFAGPCSQADSLSALSADNRSLGHPSWNTRWELQFLCTKMMEPLPERRPSA